MSKYTAKQVSIRSEHVKYSAGIDHRLTPACADDVYDMLRDYATHLREREAAKAGVTEAPVVIEAVGCVEFNAAGELDIDWLIEGGICELGAGTILLVADRKVTDDEGYGELYVAPMLSSVQTPSSLAEAFDVLEHWSRRGNTLSDDDVERFRAIADRIAPLEGARMQEREALEAIKRLPARPFPDPVAHSWEAFGRAVMGAFTDAKFIAIRALAAAPKRGEDV